MIYLTIPYTGMEDLSFKISCMIAAFLAKTGHTVYSPVIHRYTLASQYDLPTDCDFWLKQGLDMLYRCDELYVATLEGWDKSLVVSAEIEEALKMGIPVTFIDSSPFVAQ